MASPIVPKTRMTFEEYLEFEMASQVRHEFVAGEVYAMEGASRRHHDVAGNVYARLRLATAGGACKVYFEGIRLRIGDDAYYPDLMLTCSPSDTHTHMIANPCLIVEVTSPATARIDRTNKLEAYRGVQSLLAYLIVEQGWRQVVRHWRDANGAWQCDDLHGEATIRLPCPEIDLTLDQIYEGLAPLTVKEAEAIGYGAEYA